jgi:hypothetical protein
VHLFDDFIGTAEPKYEGLDYVQPNWQTRLESQNATGIDERNDAEI